MVLQKDGARVSAPDRYGNNIVLVANPSPDVYGADLQLLESVSALVDAGWRVVVAMPSNGPLVELLVERGAECLHFSFPVLRRRLASVAGVLGLSVCIIRSLPGMLRLIKRLRPSVIYVNTVTLPWWLM